MTKTSLCREVVVVAYEFKCKECGEQFEIECHMDEREEKAVCPKCGGRNVESVLTSSFGSPRPS
ncbi:MAG TPA: FmdB family zinc ribbon protein [Thermoleophilia bacterium]|nr:FmdB family zinc ribbon protein [Thermoleophilia bacterium]